MQHHARDAGVVRLGRIQCHRHPQPVFQRQHHAHQHRLAAEGLAQLLRIAFGMPGQHLCHRDHRERVAGAEVDQPGATRGSLQRCAHALCQPGVLAAARRRAASRKHDPPHHRILVKADQARGQVLRADQRDEAGEDRAWPQVVIQRLRHHQVELAAGLQQRHHELAVNAGHHGVERLGRQHDVHAHHGRLGHHHGVHQRAQALVPERKRFVKGAEAGLVGRDDDDVVGDRLVRDLAQQLQALVIELPFGVLEARPALQHQRHRQDGKVAERADLRPAGNQPELELLEAGLDPLHAAAPYCAASAATPRSALPAACARSASSWYCCACAVAPWAL